MDMEKIVRNQREFFQTDTTKKVDFRLKLLDILLNLLKANEEELYKAIFKDLGKSEIETYSTELSVIYSEINYYLKNLKKLIKPKSVATNLINQPGKSEIHYEPYGVSLVIGAWNYPYQLSVLPAVSALAAGNTVLVKPSELAPNTAEVMRKIINDNFPEEVFHVVTGGVEETTELLKQRFDKLFFTGSPHVGKIVYKAAAEHLTPVTLELGGKSPVIVTASSNLKVAARRIIWGKFLNAGQTCLAPDYVYVEESIEAEFLSEVKQQLTSGAYDYDAESYTRIINSKNFDRLEELIDKEKLFFGGKSDRSTLYMEPTIIRNTTWEDKVMQEEIFGPILPVMTYRDFDQVIREIKTREKPLSAYLFTSKKDEEEQFLNTVSFGGGCINDSIMHFTNPNLPFGGVGNSGIGNYHGQYGLEAFSHKKSILKKATWGEPNLKYPPYTESKKRWIKRIM